MASGTVAAINRQRSMLAVRCSDGQYMLLRFYDNWMPFLGEGVDGVLNRLGTWEIQVKGAGSKQVEIRSFNCSVAFAHARLSE